MSTTPTLRGALGDYLAVRRSLGFKLARDGLLLEQFIAFCEHAGTRRVTREVALAWVCALPNASAAWLGIRLTVVRGFATWLQASDSATEVPERGWLPPRRRPTPYLYSDAEVAALVKVARRVRRPLSAATYETLIGWLVVTGMRIGEVVRLDRSDMALDDGLITVRETKFGKSRHVVLHPTTVCALRVYQRERAALSPAPAEPALFVHPAGNRVTYQSVCAMFRTFVRRAGLEPRSPRCKPTIHGLRHTFAVNTLVRWYRDGVDVQARLPVLSTWMGHVDPKPSLTGTPEKNGSTAMSSKASKPRFSWQSSKVSRSEQATWNQWRAPEIRAPVSSEWITSSAMSWARSTARNPSRPPAASVVSPASQPVDTGAPHTWASRAAARATGRCWPASR